MVSTASTIADALAAALPQAKVLPYAKGVDNMPVGQPFVMVYRTQVAPGIHQGTHTETVAIWVANPVTDPARADEDLEPLLDAVLEVLDGKPLPSLSWELAERVALTEAWPAWQINATILTAKE